MKKIILGLIFFLIGLSSQSTGKVTGRVVENISRQPIPGVNVILEGTQIGSATDIEGKIEISNVPIGNYQRRISA